LEAALVGAGRRVDAWLLEAGIRVRSWRGAYNAGWIVDSSVTIETFHPLPPLTEIHLTRLRAPEGELPPVYLPTFDLLELAMSPQLGAEDLGVTEGLPRPVVKPSQPKGFWRSLVASFSN
jgi:hypothetical protein